MPKLSGRVALVTGAGSAIGDATARLLVACGALVYCADAASHITGVELPVDGGYLL